MTTRARAAAWSVFLSMAGTTMSFQVYHSVKHGDMPWPLAYLYGIVPLLISMLVIEFVAGWKDAPKWVRPAAYLIIGGSMYLSASATGAVVFRAAPQRSSLLFGLLLDAAAILAARFIMAAPERAAAAREAERQAELEATRTAQREAEAARAEAERGRNDERAQAQEVLARAVAERDEARRMTADVTATAEALRRELAEAQRGSADRKRTRKPAGNRGGSGQKPDPSADGEEDAPADLDSEAKVLWYLDKGYSASRAGIAAGLTDSRGRQIARLAREAPKGPDQEGSS